MRWPNNFQDLCEGTQAATQFVASKFAGESFMGGTSCPGSDWNGTYHQYTEWSLWPVFASAMAAANPTQKFNMGDSFFYFPTTVTGTVNGSPYTGDADGGWGRALATNRQALVTYGAPSNLYFPPMLWVADGTNSPDEGHTWTQAQWNQAIGAILADSVISGSGSYNIFSAFGLTGVGATDSYANNQSQYGGVGQELLAPPNGVPPGTTGQPNAPFVQAVPSAPTLTSVAAGSTGVLTLHWNASSSGSPSSYTIVQGGHAHAAYPGVATGHAVTGLVSGSVVQVLGHWSERIGHWAGVGHHLGHPELRRDMPARHMTDETGECEPGCFGCKLESVTFAPSAMAAQPQRSAVVRQGPDPRP